VSIAIILVAVVIIVGVVVVAMGGGGELARDVDEPADIDFQSWTDVARYRPPAALLGYHAAATERALQRIATVMADKDAEIAWLRGRLEQYEPEGERADGRRIAGPAAPVPEQAVPQQAGPELPVPELPVPEQFSTRQPDQDLPLADPLAQASRASSARDEG